jgi:hypothetical protein
LNIKFFLLIFLVGLYSSNACMIIDATNEFAKQDSKIENHSESDLSVEEEVDFFETKLMSDSNSCSFFEFQLPITATKTYSYLQIYEGIVSETLSPPPRVHAYC